MRLRVHQIVEGVNDFHPRQTMGRCKASHCKRKKQAKSARASHRFKPGSLTAKYGRDGHSSYWD